MTLSRMRNKICCDSDNRAVGNLKTVQFLFLTADKTETNPAGQTLPLRRKEVLPNEHKMEQLVVICHGSTKGLQYFYLKMF